MGLYLYKKKKLPREKLLSYSICHCIDLSDDWSMICLSRIQIEKRVCWTFFIYRKTSSFYQKRLIHRKTKQPTNSIKHQSFIYTQSNNQIILFLTIQFDINHLLPRILHLRQFFLTYWTQSRDITPSLSGPWINRNEWVHHIPHCSKNGTSPLDGLMFNPGDFAGSITPLKRYCWYILQPQLSRLKNFGLSARLVICIHS